MRRILPLLLIGLPVFGQSHDVLVYGATVSGIAAAIGAAQQGRSVVLVEPTARIGGIVTNGLSYTDFITFQSVGGFFEDYMRRVERYYVDRYGKDSQQVKDCFRGALAEPKVSLQILQKMLDEQKLVRVLLEHQLDAATKGPPVNGLATIRSARFQNLRNKTAVDLAARVFIDASYEGDLAAWAGASYRIGRESVKEHGERLAGHIFYEGGRILPGGTGEGDHRVQCYNYRITMTRDPRNRVMVTKPEAYDRDRYSHVVPHFHSGRLKSIFTYSSREGLLHILGMPNGKADINDCKNAPLRLSMPGENYDWPDGSYDTRRKIAERHRLYNLGMIYFLQNDTAVPESHRAAAGEWGLARDEFEDSNHFPTLIYIREARRILGEYVFTEKDALPGPGDIRTPLHHDSIAIGDYALNCHGEQKPGPVHPTVTEGDFNFLTQPYQIPYGVIVAKGFSNLLMTVAVSASHVGYSVLRMEPVYAAMGQAAGIAAHVMLEAGVEARRAPVGRIQQLLHKNRAKTIYFGDVDTTSPIFDIAQYFGTRGFFHELTDMRKIKYPEFPKRYGPDPYPYHDAALDTPIEAGLAKKWNSMASVPQPELKPGSRIPRSTFLQDLYRKMQPGSNTRQR